LRFIDCSDLPHTVSRLQVPTPISSASNTARCADQSETKTGFGKSRYDRFQTLKKIADSRALVKGSPVLAVRQLP
jgi:hypothetical protein